VYNLDTICNALLEFIDLMDLEKVHLVGHSWGGGWAVAFADRYPNRVDKIILIDSSGLHRYEQLAWELMKYPFLEKLLLQFFSEKTIQKGLEASFFNKRLVDRQMIKSIYTPLSNKEILNAQLSYSQNINWKKIKDALPRIQSKALIIWGKNDRYINVKYGIRMKKLIPDSRLEIIDQCGHSAHEEHPCRINRLIADFLV
jgi:2-hydroxy-6-oxonona-2,4-dienedioate hydrolase